MKLSFVILRLIYKQFRILSFRNIFCRFLLPLTHYCAVFPFHTPGKYQKTIDFPIFSGVIKRERWAILGQTVTKISNLVLHHFELIFTIQGLPKHVFKLQKNCRNKITKRNLFLPNAFIKDLNFTVLFHPNISLKGIKFRWYLIRELNIFIFCGYLI